ncbi:hypothetical protein BVRB_6g136710 [Beta vulgaris subsp. vulgaris]|nr:hypothetical protein BVRB_6g136710 [Beta vulgaris subsp. vulgaris]
MFMVTLLNMGWLEILIGIFRIHEKIMVFMFLKLLF